MRLISVLILTICNVFIFSQGRLFATSVEIAEISKGEREMAEAVAVEFIYSRTLERELKAPSEETDDIKPLKQGHLKVSLIKLEQLQPYAKLGVTQLEEKMKNTNIAGLGRRDITLDYDLAFSYGVGLNGIFRLPREWFIGYDLQYLRSKHNLDKVRHSSQTATSETGKTLLEEWHIAILYGKRFNLGASDLTSLNLGKFEQTSLTPYLGVRYSDLELEVKDNIEYTVSEATVVITGKSKADENIGGLAGFLVNLGDRWRLRLESRFIDETAFTISGSYSF